MNEAVEALLETGPKHFFGGGQVERIVFKTCTSFKDAKTEIKPKD